MKTKTVFIIASIFLILFIVFTLVVMNVDVQPAGPQGSNIGLATINMQAFDFLGDNDTWYTVSEIGGLLSIFAIAGFALCGLWQLLKNKSLKLVDKKLYIYAGFLAVVMIFYVLFENFVVNCRPVLIDNQLEASYPSSHTMLVICVMSASAILLRRMTNNCKVKTLSTVIAAVIITVTVVGRLLSGVHWLTDIMGGIFLSVSLVMFYYSVIKSVKY